MCAGALLACAAPVRPQEQHTVQALLVSDVHFEPFWDPGKAAKLAGSPASGWQSILESPVSADRAQRFAALQKSCHTRGDDTSFPLFEFALAAMKAHAGTARFLVVSGDSISHGFDCKFKAIFPDARPGDYRAFVQKTIAFVTGQLGRIAPRKPEYVALGNNDSDCGDYKLDSSSPFLADIGPLMLRGVPRHERDEALESFRKAGYYSVILPAPVQRTRLVVLNDILLSPSHRNCSGQPDPAPGDAQLEWLQHQLAQARAAGEHVWVMGHIPPGVNAYSTLAHMGSLCHGRPPVMYLATDRLAQDLTGAGDEIRLGIFAHAHTDEFKLLEPERPPSAQGSAETAHAGVQATPEGSPVAIKMVPAISPINGGNPAFTVAEIDPATARLRDYQVYAAKDASGAGAWPELYDFDRTYNEKSFSPEAARHVLAEFSADPAGKSAASESYIHNFLTGHPDMLLPLVWQRYVCTLSHSTAAGFTSCACASSPSGEAADR